MRYAVMSRPCTDCPITRLSVTSDGALVGIAAIVDVAAAVVDVVVVVGDVLEELGADVLSTDVSTRVVVADSVAVGATVSGGRGEVTSGSDEHDTGTCATTSSAQHHDRRVTKTLSQE